MAKVVVLSGAGISAESGISTFRDSDGLWEEYDPKEIATKDSLIKNRAKTIAFYDKRRQDLADKKPNKAHLVLAQLKKTYKNDIAIITQNVDDLFEKAGLGEEEVVHLHGFMTKVECEQCGLVYDIGYKKIGEDSFNGKCPKCHSTKIRPHIVMFGEEAPNYAKLYKELNDCEFLVVIGTSGEVLPVDAFAKGVKFSILNNYEPSEAIDDSVFSEVYYEKATITIDNIEKYIDNFFNNNLNKASKREENQSYEVVTKVNGRYTDAGLFEHVFNGDDDAYDEFLKAKKIKEDILEQEKKRYDKKNL